MEHFQLNRLSSTGSYVIPLECVLGDYPGIRSSLMDTHLDWIVAQVVEFL